MKEKLRNVIYSIILILFILSVIVFFIIPVVEAGESFSNNMTEKIEEMEDAF